MLKTLVPKFRPDLSACFKDSAKKHVPAKLKPIVVQLVSKSGGWGQKQLPQWDVLWKYPSSAG